MGDILARRRGFFAELQHQNKLTEQRQLAAARAQSAEARRAEQTQRAQQRALLAVQRASEADFKRLEKEAAAAHVAAQQAVVEQHNAGLALTYASMDTLLEATLAVDEYVDLETLRQTVSQPPFDGHGLDRPTPAPEPLMDPAAPVFRQPAPPTGLFGRKKKLAEAQSLAEASFAEAQAWSEREMRELPGRRQQLATQHAAAERNRQEKLAAARARYESECAVREIAVSEHNAALDQLIANLGYGAVEAVQEYVGIVLANSVYPEDFSVEHEAEFDPANAELSIRVTIPKPNLVPTIKAYRYVKASDEITPTALSQKDAKDRYAGIGHQVALRTLHEIFEADRRGLIQSISLNVGTQTTEPATGRETYIPFVAVAVSREVFAELELAAVVPLAALEHLGASLSKNPLGLVAANTAGVRRSL